MDQERACYMFFLVLFVILFLFPLSSLQVRDGAASTGNPKFHFPPLPAKNFTLFGGSFVKNESLQFPLGAAVMFFLAASFQGTKENSSAFFSREFSFSVKGSNISVLFYLSEQLILDEQVQALEFGHLLISTNLFKFKDGGLVTTGEFYNARNISLSVCLLHSRNRIKNPGISPKIDLGNQFLLLLYTDFSASKKAGNQTNLLIKSRGFEISRPDSSYGKKEITLGIYTPVLAVMSIFSALWSYFRKFFKKKKDTPEITSLEDPVSTQDSNFSTLLVGFQRFTYRELSAATKNFNQSELLGKGRYASVYRAVFRGSINMFAVKRFNESTSSKFSFEIEVNTIHRLRHRRILELRGWCDENPNERLLLYDYMHNRSLEEALRNRNLPLLWPLRYKIAVGVAEALAYLHEACSPRVIHGDIKEANVMLDVDFNPKLGDFGLAMSAPPYVFRREKTERDPPECQPLEDVTEKVDVYMYGSLLLGLCCRRTEQLKKFHRKLQSLKLNDRLLEAVDKTLNERYNEEEMLRLLNVALQCLEQRVKKRPSMVQVLQILTEGEREEPEPIFHIEI